MTAKIEAQAELDPAELTAKLALLPDLMDELGGPLEAETLGKELPEVLAESKTLAKAEHNEALALKSESALFNSELKDFKSTGKLLKKPRASTLFLGEILYASKLSLVLILLGLLGLAFSAGWLAVSKKVIFGKEIPPAEFLWKLANNQTLKTKLAKSNFYNIPLTFLVRGIEFGQNILRQCASRELQALAQASKEPKAFKAVFKDVPVDPAPLEDVSKLCLTNLYTLTYKELLLEKQLYVKSPKTLGKLPSSCEKLRESKYPLNRGDLTKLALFRLAYVFNDREALMLLKSLSKEESALALTRKHFGQEPPLKQAVTLGFLILDGKASVAFKLAQKILTSKAFKKETLTLEKSPVVLLYALSAFSLFYETKKLNFTETVAVYEFSQQLLEPLGQEGYAFFDFLLPYATLYFLGGDLAASKQVLAKIWAHPLLKKGPDLDRDLLLRIALQLESVKNFRGLAEVVEILVRSLGLENNSLGSREISALIEEIQPARRADFFRLASRQALLAGDFLGSLSMLKERVKLVKNNAPSLIEYWSLREFLKIESATLAAEFKTALVNMGESQEKIAIFLAYVKYYLRQRDLNAVFSLLEEYGPWLTKFNGNYLKYIEGLTALAEHKEDLARKIFVEIWQKDKSFTLARLELFKLNFMFGKEKLEVKQVKEAFKEIDNMVKTTSLNEAFYLRALVKEALGDLQGAFKDLRESLWENPDFLNPLQLLFHYAALENALNMQDEALALLNKLSLKEQDKNPLIILEIIKLKRASKQVDYEAVVKLYERLLEKYPDTLEYYISFAKFYNELSKYKEAKKVLDDCLRIDKAAKNVEVLKQFAIALEEKDTLKAKAYLEEAVRLDTQPDSYLYLAKILEKRNRPDEALNAYREADKLGDLSAPIRLHVAELLIQRNLFLEAAKQLEQVLAKDPNNLPAYILLGDARRESGEARRALKSYTLALNFAKDVQDKTSLLMKIAKINLYDLKLKMEALKYLKQVTRLNQTQSEAYYLLAVTFKDLELLREACKNFQVYLNLAPKGEYAEEVRVERENLCRKNFK